eukprot:scaffold74056_cov72-Phaeocystis_antarctica.AAC.4
MKEVVRGVMELIRTAAADCEGVVVPDQWYLLRWISGTSLAPAPLSLLPPHALSFFGISM